MFTGLVQRMGTVTAVEDGRGGRTLRVTAAGPDSGLELGESIAVNGACLTVADRDGTGVSFQAGPETLAKTNLGMLKPGDRVNVERALRVGDALGGHFVTGHVDCTGTVVEIRTEGEWLFVSFGYPPEFDVLLVPKGSVAVDGVSLTVVSVETGRLSVMLVPHTRAQTTLGQRDVGSVVNLEFDLLAKHVRRLVGKAASGV
jgi:riboflavin synthase